jgi:hypothetical protein
MVALHRDDGTSLIEVLIATSLTVVVVGTGVMLAAGVQSAYAHDQDDAAVREEAQFALAWIGQVVSAAGSNPYGVAEAECLEADAPFAALQLDPDGNGVHDDLRVQADINPPNKIVGGPAGSCEEMDEDVTIAFDAESGAIVRDDVATGGAEAITDGVFTNLRFSYLTAARAPTTSADAVAFVRVELTAESPSRNPMTGQRATVTLSSEIPLRAR